MDLSYKQIVKESSNDKLLTSRLVGGCLMIGGGGGVFDGDVL